MRPSRNEPLPAAWTVREGLEAAGEHEMHLLVGGPWESGHDKPYLGAFLLSAEPTVCYAKVHVHVHETEARYFAAGEQVCVVPVRSVPTGLAICADTSFPQHAAEAAGRGTELYVASVLNPEADYARHAANLAGYAQTHGMAVLTANYAGSSGGFVSAGGSAFWDERGRLVARADTRDRALVIARRGEGEGGGEVIIDP